MSETVVESIKAYLRRGVLCHCCNLDRECCSSQRTKTSCAKKVCHWPKPSQDSGYYGNTCPESGAQKDWLAEWTGWREHVAGSGSRGVPLDEPSFRSVAKLFQGKQNNGESE